MRIKRAWPVVAQFAGAMIAACGVYGLVGPLWTLVAVGVVAVAVGTLAELKGGQ